MIRRSIVLALAAAIAPLSANADDLLQTYEMARNGDPTLAIAESTRLYNKEGEVQARAALLPQISGSAGLTRTNTDTDGISGTVTTKRRNYTANLSQTLFDWSQFATLRAQRALSQAADYTLVSANDDLMVRTATAYFDVLVAIESLSAAQTAEAAAKRQFEYADKRLEVGLAPITDVYEARAQYDDARANTINAKNVLEDSYQALVQLAGQPVRNLRALPDNFNPQLPTGYNNIDGWVRAAITQNPALQAYDYQTRSAQASVESARGGHYPSLALNGSWGKSATWGDATGAGGLTAGSETNSVGIALTVPIFTGGATQSRVRQALAQRDNAQDQYELQRRQLERNTRNLYQSLVAGVSKIEAQRSAVESAQSAYDASLVGLEVGTRTVLDVVQNQRTLFAAQVTYAQSKYEFLLNRLLLAQAAGEIDIANLRDVNLLLTEDAESKLTDEAPAATRAQ
ncbi:MAG: TolC family outer membrane protein [Xanthomonadaceae bacterium]|jgi:outer membrane protein|nr:TolC family outer membrane protein [Xanthomonadaceae bacterium]